MLPGGIEQVDRFIRSAGAPAEQADRTSMDARTDTRAVGCVRRWVPEGVQVCV